MNTWDKLNLHLANQVPAMRNSFEGAIHFLCTEIDQLHAPIKIQYTLFVDALVPAYQTDGASGLDLHAQAFHITGQGRTLFEQRPFVLMPGASVNIWAGIAFSIPKGWEIQVRPRSSMSKQQIHVCLGTIDSDYRGEIGVLLINLSPAPYLINKHDRVAQMVFAPIGRFELERVEVLEETKRGCKCFGSTGK